MTEPNRTHLIEYARIPPSTPGHPSMPADHMYPAFHLKKKTLCTDVPLIHAPRTSCTVCIVLA
jgi:hypothetical protein